MIVTIDGPAGAGKSTVASLLAERLGFRYLDTGAMYRALTWLAMQEAIDLSSGDKLGALARENRVELDESGRVSIAGSDVTSAIRQSRIDRMVPVVARHPEVREVMRERQQELAELGDAVIEAGTSAPSSARTRTSRSTSSPTGAFGSIAARPSGRTSGPTRSPPTFAPATTATARACSPPRTRK